MFLSIALMTADVHQRYISFIQSGVSLLVMPVRTAVDLPIRMLDSLGSHVLRQQYLMTENNNLRQQVFQLKATLQRFKALQHENAELRGLLQSARHLHERVLVGRIINVQQRPWVHRIVANRGSGQGIYLNQPVLDSAGVMGQVIETHQHSASVLLITDPMSAVPVVDTRTQFRSVVVGTGSNDTLQLRYVTKSNPLKVGDKLYTSGLGETYPAGYPVGQISEIKQTPGERFSTVTVVPAARLMQSQQILFVWLKGAQHA